MERSLQLFMQQMLFHLLLDNLQVILLYHQILLINLLNKQHQLEQINQISKQLHLNLENTIRLMEHSIHLYISKIQKNRLMVINLHLCKLNIIKKMHLIQPHIKIIHISIISLNIKMMQMRIHLMIVMNTVILMNDKVKLYIFFNILMQKAYTSFIERIYNYDPYDVRY